MANPGTFPGAACCYLAELPHDEAAPLQALFKLPAQEKSGLPVRPKRPIRGQKGAIDIKKKERFPQVISPN